MIKFRLPMLQGAAFSYLPPTFAILALPKNQCPAPLPDGYGDFNVTMYNDTDGSIIDGNELWMRRIVQVIHLFIMNDNW